MERTVFVLGVAGAILFAMFSLWGGPNLHFTINGVGSTEPVIEARAETLAERVYVGRSLEIDHAALRVVVTPEAREDIAISIENPGRLPTPSLSAEDGHLRLDGRLRGRVDGCPGETVHVRGYGDISEAEMPVVRVRMPMDLALDLAGGGSIAELGPAESVDLDLSGCVHARTATVSGLLSIDIAGAGQVEAGDAGTLEVDSAGSTRVSVGRVAGDAEVSMAGSSQTEIASVNGAFSGETVGSGGMHLASGTLSRLDVSLGGSGEFAMDSGSVGEAEIEIAGSGHARIAAPIASLNASLAGSGEVDVEGEVGELDAEVAGSGVVRVRSVTGSVTREVFGAGRVIIGE